MKLIVGCPIYKRSWIFPYWVYCLENQSIPLSDVGFVFETSPDDSETLDYLKRWRSGRKDIPVFEIIERSDIPHFEHEKNSRQWTMSKYHNMVEMRNNILSKVREYNPNYYFSLDSDVLLKHPSTLELLMAHVDSGADAVNTLMYMTPFGTQFPSVMTWKNDEEGRAFREESYPLGSFFKSDIIMAAKMMSHDVYHNVNYEFHVQGEDLGWSLDAKRKGYDLYCASYIYTPHIMHEDMLAAFLKQGDEREAILFENHIKI